MSRKEHKKVKGDSIGEYDEDNESNLKVLFMELEKRLMESIKSSENQVKDHVDTKCIEITKKIDQNKIAIDKISQVANEALTIARENEKALSNLTDNFSKLENENSELKKQISELNILTSMQAINIKVIQTRLEDQTNRSSRKSLVIRGVPENGEKNWDDTRVTIVTALAKWTKLEYNNIDGMIERVHRGRPNDKKAGKRDIFAGFHNWNDSETIKNEFRKHG